jgi:twitching motility protein PilI
MDSVALQTLDLLHQNYARDAVAPPAYEEKVMYWVGTSLGVAGVALLIGAGELEEVIETPDMAAIPGTKPWVMGVAGHKGGLLPIIDGDVLFRGKSYTGRQREYCMVIRRPGFYFGITLSHIERDIKFPIELRDMDASVDPDFAEYCLGGFHHRDGFCAVLDIEKLLQKSGFSNASMTQLDSTEEKTNE